MINYLGNLGYSSIQPINEDEDEDYDLFNFKRK